MSVAKMIFFNFEPSVVNHTEESEQNGCEQNENTMREHLAICDQKIALIEADIKQSVTGTAKVVADVEKLSARYDPSFCIIQFLLYFECGLPFFLIFLISSADSRQSTVTSKSSKAKNRRLIAFWSNLLMNPRNSSMTWLRLKNQFRIPTDQPPVLINR